VNALHSKRFPAVVWSGSDPLLIAYAEGRINWRLYQQLRKQERASADLLATFGGE
jgi:hypothetical protein